MCSAEWDWSLAACVLREVQSEIVERRVFCVQCRVGLGSSGFCVVCSAE